MAVAGEGRDQLKRVVDQGWAGDQGRRHAVLQGEAPIEVLATQVVSTGEAYGHVAEVAIPRVPGHQFPRANGYPAVPEFPTQRELNMGQARMLGKKTAGVPNLHTDSYDAARRSVNISSQ